MTNKIIRQAKCELCKDTWPIRECSPATYGDQGEHHVLCSGTKVVICSRCWNRNVNEHIFFGPNGWEWKEAA